MTNKPTEQAALGRLTAEDYLRARYGAYRGHFAWRELEDAFNAGAESGLAKQPEATQIAPVDKGSYQRMFEAACVDLGLINEALGLAPEDGGAEPILSAIAELKEQALGQGLTDGGVDKDLPVTRDWQLGWDECIAHFGLDSVAPAALQPPPVGVEPIGHKFKTGSIKWASEEAMFAYEGPLYATPAPAAKPLGGATYEPNLRAVLDVVQRYLPPDGLSIDDAMNEIIAIVDPWPAATKTKA